MALELDVVGAMDKLRPPRARRMRIACHVVLVAGLVAGALAASRALLAALEPSLRYADLRTDRVDSGALDASVTASGIVVPEVEEVLASPIDSRVIRILKR